MGTDRAGCKDGESNYRKNKETGIPTEHIE
jgi:hypothetical protein